MSQLAGGLLDCCVDGDGRSKFCDKNDCDFETTSSVYR